MSKHPGVIAFAALFLVVVAVRQIGLGIYYLGCFRRYNQIIDTLAKRFDDIDPEEAIEMIRNFVFIGIAIVLIITVSI